MLTLGADVILWAESMLAWPGAEPLRLTADQMRFLLKWYEVDELGRRIRRTRGVYSRPKGAGKSPLGAIVSAAEAWGPVIPDGLDAAGRPVGKPREAAEVLVFATEEGQAGNVYGPLCDLLINGRALEEYRLDVGLGRILDDKGASIYPMSAAASSKDGRRTDFALLDETHLMWKLNLRELTNIIRRNLAKRGGRSLEVTTAWRPGQRSVAEQSWEFAQAVKEGRIPDQGLLFDMRTAPAPADWDNDDELRACLSVAYEDCTEWVDLDRLVSEARDPSVSRADVERYFLNRIVASDDAFVPPEMWERCRTGIRPALGESITLGFDGSMTNDATALVGVSIESGVAFLVGLWECPPDAKDWEVDQREVDATIGHVFRDFSVERFYADPFRWQDWLAAWQDRHGDVVRAWYTHRERQMFDALNRLRDAISGGLVAHCGEDALTRHVNNATRHVTRAGWTISKPPGMPKAKIDACVALCLAWEARADVMAKGWSKAKKERDKPRPSLVSF
jgi:phage terminase large subunit-like protein